MILRCCLLSLLLILLEVFLSSAASVRENEGGIRSREARAITPANYIVTFPNSLKPGIPLAVHVNILTATSPVSVTAHLERHPGGTLISQQTISIPQESARVVELQVPENILTTGGHKVIVSGTGGLTFRVDNVIAPGKDNIFIFIQTDKGRYTSSQEVKYRVVVVHPDFSMYKGTIDLEITDGNDNKIERMLLQPLTNGVFRMTLQLSLEPVFGTWCIHATAKIYKEKACFDVRPYVLPRFEVVIRMPDVITSTMTDVAFQILAKFTFDRDVIGNTTLQLYDGQKRQLEFQQKLTGQTTITVPVSTIKSKFGQSATEFNVRALVTDNATALTMGAEAKAYFEAATSISIALLKSARTFTPSLTYSSGVEVKEHRGTQKVDVSGQSLKVEVSIQIANDQLCKTATPPHYYVTFSDTTLPTQLIPLTSSGLGQIRFDVPTKAYKITMKLTYKDKVESIPLEKLDRGKHYLTAVPEKNPIQVGENLEFTVESTKSMTGSLHYEVISKGILMNAGKVVVNNVREKLVVASSNSGMAPRSRVLVYYVDAGGAPMLFDSFTIEVAGAPFRNKVDFKYSASAFSPNQTAMIEVTSEPFSTVYVTTVDERVKLLQAGNDIDIKKAGKKAFDSIRTTKENIVQHKASTGSEGISAIARSGVIFLTDGSLEQDAKDVIDRIATMPTTCKAPKPVPPVIPKILPRPLPFPDIGRRLVPVKRTHSALDVDVHIGLHGHSKPNMADAPGIFDDAMISAAADVPVVIPNVPDILPSVPDVQQKQDVEEFIVGNFPETWTWTELQIGSTGKATLSQDVPDTITSWIASVFSVNEKSGFAVALSTQRVTVSENFFATMDLPEYMILGEEGLIQVTVFNYGVDSKREQVFMGIRRSDKPTQPISRGMDVAANSGLSMYIKFTAEALGPLFISVQVAAGGGFFWGPPKKQYSLTKQVLVRPQGVYHESNKQNLIGVSNGDFSTKVPVTYPPNVISATKYVQATITGDIMTPSIVGLEQLLKMPYGCGEQNMLNFAPAVYITGYLKTVGKLTSEIQKKALSYMESGKQRQFTYQRSDGSFSAFGNRDSSGSSWLTGFVLKCFREADDLIYIDGASVHKSIDWLLNQQNSDGSFREPGRVIHKGMQSGTSSGVKLTAYITISLLENKNTDGLQTRITAASARSKTYLEAQLPGVHDSYTLAMLCYTLKLADSSQAATCYKKLKGLSISIDKMLFWRASGTTSNSPTVLAVDIETSSYGLLTAVANGDFTNAYKIVTWLVSQRNSNGGFKSTQDTVLALQALTDYSSKTTIQSPSETVNVFVRTKTSTSQTSTNQYQLGQLNKDILHSIELPSDATEVEIQAVGTGLALVNVIISCYVEPLSHSDTFDLTQTITKESLNSITVRVCAKWKGSGTASGMAVMEVGIPTGFKPDIQFLKEQSIIKRYEERMGNVVFYFDRFSSHYDCVNVKSDRADPVVKSQAVSVVVYDYYEPSNQAMGKYESGILKSSNICLVCPHCNFCVTNTVTLMQF